MMEMEEALIARLLAAPAITAIFGNRIHWQRRPATERDLPALTLNIAADPRAYHHDAPDDLQEARVQFDVRAESYLGMKIGARVVLSEMEAEKDQADVHFDEGLKVSGSDAPNETLGGGTEVFRYTMDIMVSFRQIV